MGREVVLFSSVLTSFDCTAMSQSDLAWTRAILWMLARTHVSCGDDRGSPQKSKVHRERVTTSARHDFLLSVACCFHLISYDHIRSMG